MRLRKRPFNRDQYVDRVVSYLSKEFGWTSITEGICRGRLRLHDDHIDPRLELICDEPIAANWRLKSTGRDGQPWGLRMAYYGAGKVNGPDRADRVTRALAWILETQEVVR